MSTLPTPLTVYWLSIGGLVVFFKRSQRDRYWLLLVGLSLLFCGCAPAKHSTSVTPQEFETAGAAFSVVDTDQLVGARMETGPYRVVTRDLLEFQLPSVLGSSPDDKAIGWQKMETYQCRVSDANTVLLPVVGELEVSGKTVADIETLIEEAFYPRYVVRRPEVVGIVKEYHSENITITGAVRQPGIYPCHHNELTLVNALMKAGGLSEKGAGMIRIRHSGGQKTTEPLALPVKGVNLNFSDVALCRGDVIEVEPLSSQAFTVVGLVHKPGVFPFEPHLRYNAMQALACAGGVNEVADPQYVRVYRQKADGQIIDATFKIDGLGMESLSRVTLKPGDVVSVEQTLATRTRLLFSDVFRIAAGVDVRPSYQ